MPVTNGYVIPDSVLGRLQIKSGNYDGQIDDAINDASREIDTWCGRSFVADSTATARVFYPEDYLFVAVDDYQRGTVTSVKTDTNGDGTFPTTWLTTDYQQEPLNGIVQGISGWPVTALRSVGSNRFPTYNRRASVQVTAKWGWAAIPEPVRQSCAVLVSAIIAQDQAPGGVVIGSTEFGNIRLPYDQFRLVQRKLVPYVRAGGDGCGSFA